MAIIYMALSAPLRQIAENAGVSGQVVIYKINENYKKSKTERIDNYGYNSETGGYGDMIKMGIIDPAKVTRSALQNAASIASLILTTEALVADKPEEKKELPAMGANPYGGMGM
jgi:chaperonin GroEL